MKKLICPDLTPCDFFLWSWAKGKGNQSKPRTLLNLELKFKKIPNEFMRMTVEDVPKSLPKCIKSARSYIEV